MSASIEKVAVIGAGTMGAAIAAHVANAGLPVVLLDIVPGELSEKEKAAGLSLESPKVRNRIVQEGFGRIAKIKPASFMSDAGRDLVRLGNLEDDLGELAGADWIVEAVIEKLEVKRALMEKVDAVRKAGSIVTTNTSGLPISSIVEGRSEDFRRCFFGTHFFNPPRYMKLLEVIRGAETDEDAVARLVDFASRRLGKGVVFCKDTPNFIGNRILSVHGSFIMDYGVANGYRFEEVDAVTGPLIGRPKTATYRLQDLVGIDVAAYVGKNLHRLIPDDPHRDVLVSPRLTELVGGLMERGALGNKTRKGFYKKTKGKGGKPVFEVLNPETYEYEPQQDVAFPSLGAVARIRDLGERIQALFEHDDRGAKLARVAVTHFLGYAAERSGDIAFDLASVDRAIRWGFSYKLGPFELWDALGVAAMAERMKEDGVAVASWVKEMLDAGCESFYRREDGRVSGYYDWNEKAYKDLETDPRHVALSDLHADGKENKANAAASLLDLGDGVLLLEFHSKMNAIDDAIVEMMNEAAGLLEDGSYRGLVIGNDGPNFCVGANLKAVAEAAAAGQFDNIRDASGALQATLQRLKYSASPVVAAVHGMALGGGAEISMGANRIVAASESYFGQVEIGVGLLPAGGGMKELNRRLLSPAARGGGDPLPAAQKIFETVTMAKVSTSAAEAAGFGFLGTEDRVVMNRDHLLHEAKHEVQAMLSEGWVAPVEGTLYAGGRDLLAALKVVIWSLVQAGWASPHDALVAEKTAYVLTGGDASAAQWLPEEHFLRLEREAFAELVATEKTQERIRHMLETGKPLRN